MPRSSSSRSSSRSAPAPKRSGPPPAARTPPPPAPSSQMSSALPAQGGGGGMLAGLGATMAQGFAFGTGSAIARTAVDSVMGGRSSAPAPEAPAQAVSAPSESQFQVPSACRLDHQAFNDCIRLNTANASNCEFYFNALKACQQTNM